MTIFIERGIRHNDKSIYVEDIFVEQDSVWKNDRRLAAFTITEDVVVRMLVTLMRVGIVLISAHN